MQEQTSIDFSTFIISMASNAYCCLGIVENPLTKKKEKNLSSAKQQIDLIDMLREKTKGNLNEQENKLMETVSFQLKSAYIDAIK